jgi:N-acetylmuramoyl-L-alanine amidase
VTGAAVLENGVRCGVRVVLLAVALTPGLLTPSHAAVVRAVRTIRSEDFTRIIVECSERVEYRVSRAEGAAPRFAVDFPGASLPTEGLTGLSFEAGPAKSARAVRTENGVRLLIETREKASASTFPLLDPFRLVIDVGAAHEQAARLPTPAPGSRVPAIARAKPTATTASRAGESAGRKLPQLHAGRQPPPEIRAGAGRLKLMIDAGHGGHDPGAHGVGDLWEKDIVLDIALRLADKARGSGLFDVRLTRDDDTFVPLEERTARANAFGAEVFLSIHGNAAPTPDLNGMETYYLNNTNDRATIRLAQMENGLTSATGGAARGADVSFILSDLVQSYKVEESVGLAETLQKSAVASARRIRPELHDIGIKPGPFYVLVGAGMPAVLVEVSFLTHPDEGRALGQAAYREAIAEGLLQGLRRFVENRQNAETL